MRHDDVDAFDLDAPAVTTPRARASQQSQAAATPSSFLSLDFGLDLDLPELAPSTVRSPLTLRSPHLVASPPPSHFPFPSLEPLPSSIWSPAFPSASPPNGTDRPRICVDLRLLDSNDPSPSPSSLPTPPSPLGLPGTFAAWRRRRSLPGTSPTKGKPKVRESLGGELLLPPPFLDETGDANSRKSFEGILGSRSARHAERVRLEHEKLYKTGRSPPLPFPQSFFRGIGKLIAVLGPPSGYELAPGGRTSKGVKTTAVERYAEQQRRRVQRAESGLKAYEFGAKVGTDVAGRLRRGLSHRADKMLPARGESADLHIGPSPATPPQRSGAQSSEEDPLSSARLEPCSPSIDTVLATESYFPPTCTSNSTPAKPHAFEIVVWILIGSSDSLDSVGGVIGFVVHLVGFSFFVILHSTTLAAASIVAVRTVGIFVYWMSLNLCGRTEISKAVIAYWKSCRKEWDRVCIEEEGGKALSTWSVMRGLAELAALHSMTRSRWLDEELTWLEIGDTLDGTSHRSAMPVTRQPSVRKPKPKSPRVRPSFTMQRSSFRWNRSEGDEDAEGLVVTSNAGSLLEGTLIASASDDVPTSTRRRTFSPQAIPAIVNELTDEPGPLDSVDPVTSADAVPVLHGQPGEQDYREKDLISLLKRYGRLSTAAYGLQTYIVSPPTPLLTPSGATLPHRLFAHLGGVKDHRNVLHVALQKNQDSTDVDPVYSPAFYLLRDDSRRQIIVVFRGTQSLADIKTDLEGDFVALVLAGATTDAPGPSTHTAYRIHAGILTAARHLLNPPESPLFKKLAASLEETGYDLFLTGHSLGSALASTVALLVSDYDPDLKRWTTSARSGLPARRSIRAITFAHPTTLNGPLAARCAIGSPPLVVSVSLGSDVVTRAGLPQLRYLRRTLGRLDRARTAAAAAAAGRDAAAIMTNWWTWRNFVQLERRRGDDFATLADPKENERRRSEIRALEDSAWRIRLEVEPALRDDDNSTEDRVDTATPAGKAYHLDELPSRVTAERRQLAQPGPTHADEDEDEDDDDDETLLLGLYEVRNPDSFYRTTLLSSDLIRSHLPKEYLDAVESL